MKLTIIHADGKIVVLMVHSMANVPADLSWNPGQVWDDNDSRIALLVLYNYNDGTPKSVYIEDFPNGTY